MSATDPKSVESVKQGTVFQHGCPQFSGFKRAPKSVRLAADNSNGGVDDRIAKCGEAIIARASFILVLPNGEQIRVPKGELIDDAGAVFLCYDQGRPVRRARKEEVDAFYGLDLLSKDDDEDENQFTDMEKEEEKEEEEIDNGRSSDSINNATADSDATTSPTKPVSGSGFRLGERPPSASAITATVASTTKDPESNE